MYTAVCYKTQWIRKSKDLIYGNQWYKNSSCEQTLTLNKSKGIT